MSTIDEQLFREPEVKFIEHISIPNNNRIIFSSKFGTGKTTFLKHFFTENGFTKKEKTHYEVFHLFPVNYSIASTEDILELIKYDITLELLKKNERISVYQDNIETTTSFVKKHYDKVIELVIAALPKIDPSITLVDIPGIVKNFFELKRAYEAHAKKENLQVNQGDSFVEFLDQSDNKIGKLYESNYITQIIQSVLVKHKEDFQEQNNEEFLENVLILDDLDRIDPEHIFRILNVFGAHFDSSIYKHKGLTNKFGFDMIILVCDINNIRKIFSARYGQDVDFSGYIDKFYSKSVFYFDTNRFFKEFVKQKLDSVIFIYGGNKSNFVSLLGNRNYNILIELLVTFYKSESLNIRKLVVLEEYINLPIRINLFGIERELNSDGGILLCMLFVKILGGIQVVYDGLINLQKQKINMGEKFQDFAHELFRINSRPFHRLIGNHLTNYIESGYPKYQPVLIKLVHEFRDSDYYEVKKMISREKEGARVIFDNEDIYIYLFDMLIFLNQNNLVL